MMRLLVTATMMAAVALATPASANPTARSANPTARQVAARSGRGAGDVETRIKTLHSQLHITAQQEGAWNNVAEVMRTNAKAMQDARAKAQQPSGNAIDQLNSYASVVDAHSDGVHKFIPAFQALYDGMSDAQKKTADQVLRTRAKEAVRRHAQ